MHIDWSQVPGEQLTPLITRRFINQAGMTIARFRLRKGAVVDMHHHSNAQLTNVLSGALRLNVAGQSVIVRAGESLTIEPHVPHEAFADEDCDVLDVFVPERADWGAKDDAYLRVGRK